MAAVDDEAAGGELGEPLREIMGCAVAVAVTVGIEVVVRRRRV